MVWISTEAKKLIRNVPMNAQGEKDRYVWLKERNGKYSVRTEYHALKECQERKNNVSPSIS